MFRTTVALLALVGVLLAVCYWRAPIQPLAWQVPPAPAMQGVLAPNQLLQQARLLAPEQLNGPEDVAFDASGRVYTATADGAIWWLDSQGQAQLYFRGEPLKRGVGMAFDQQGNLYVCDAYQGLILITPQRQARIIVSAAAGEAFGLTDDVDVAANGKVYFTDATSKYNVDTYQAEALEARGHGRLLEYDPKTGEVRVLMSGLYFANGVAVAADGRSVLVNETFRYRVQRYWLAGEKAGQAEIFADNLPGFPDGIASDGEGNFWLALFAPRLAFLDQIHAFPWLKRVIAGLPDWLRPQPAKVAMVIKLDANGQIVQLLHDGSGDPLFSVTSAEQLGDSLYLGSLVNQGLGVYPLKVAAAKAK